MNNSVKMKKKIIFVIILIFILTATTNVFAGDDKLKHFGVSSIFGAASESCLHYKTKLKTSERILLATTLGSFPGLIKELVDSTKAGKHFSGGDMAANIGGAFFGAIVSNLLNNIIQIKIGKTEDNKTTVISLSYRF